MATIKITAFPATFSEGCMTIEVCLSKPMPSVKIDASKAKQVEDTMRALCDSLRKENPSQGLYVTATKLSGRAPNGFNNIEPIKYDPAKELADA